MFSIYCFKYIIICNLKFVVGFGPWIKVVVYWGYNLKLILGIQFNLGVQVRFIMEHQETRSLITMGHWKDLCVGVSEEENAFEIDNI